MAPLCRPSGWYRVLVRLQCSGGGTDSVGSVEALEEKEAQGSSCNPTVLGRITVDSSSSWTQLSAALGHLLSSHLQILCGEAQAAREEAQRSVLGLGPTSISSVLIGEETHSSALHTLSFTLSLSFHPSALSHRASFDHRQPR